MRAVARQGLHGSPPTLIGAGPHQTWAETLLINEGNNEGKRLRTTKRCGLNTLVSSSHVATIHLRALERELEERSNALACQPTPCPSLLTSPQHFKGRDDLRGMMDVKSKRSVDTKTSQRIQR